MKLNIKDKLAEKKITRYELAKRIGVTYPTITSIYNGESTSIKLEILEALCRELDCTPNEIVATDNKEITYNIEKEKLSSQIAPAIIEMLNLNIQNKPDFIHYIPINDEEGFQKRLDTYINLIYRNKKGDTE